MKIVRVMPDGLRVPLGWELKFIPPTVMNIGWGDWDEPHFGMTVSWSYDWNKRRPSIGIRLGFILILAGWEWRP